MEDDARLIERLRRRDEAAFSELVRTHQAQVFRVVRRMVRSDEEAEDLTQEVFIAVFRAIESFRGDSKLSTWIFRIAMNVTKNRVKYLGRRQSSKHGEYEDDKHGGADHGELHGGERSAAHAAPDAILESRQTSASLAWALASLDEEQRAVLVLRDFEGLAYEDIQAATGLPEGTVKSRLHRARLAIHAALRGESRGDGDGESPVQDARESTQKKRKKGTAP